MTVTVDTTRSVPEGELTAERLAQVKGWLATINPEHQYPCTGAFLLELVNELVKLTDRVLVESGLGDRFDLRVVALRGMPVRALAERGGIPVARRGTCSIRLLEVQT